MTANLLKHVGSCSMLIKHISAK